MGNIEFYGIKDEYEKIYKEELAQCEIPDNAHIINEFTQMNMKSLCFNVVWFSGQFRNDQRIYGIGLICKAS